MRRFTLWARQRKEAFWVIGIALAIITVGLAFWFLQAIPSLRIAVASTTAAAIVAWFASISAWHASRLARTNEHTLAELREQRYLQSVPWVFPKLAEHHAQTINLNLEFRNVGNGPALMVQAFMVTGVDTRTAIDAWMRTGNVIGSPIDGPKWASLAPNESVNLSHELFENKLDANGLLIITYGDIYARTFLSGYEYSVADNAITLDEPIYPIVKRSQNIPSGTVTATGESEDGIWESLERIENKIDTANDRSSQGWIIGIGIAAVVGAPGLRDLSINGMIALYVIGLLLIALSPLARRVSRRNRTDR